MFKKLAAAVIGLSCLSTYAGEIKSSFVSGHDQDKMCMESFDYREMALRPDTKIYLNKHGQISALIVNYSIEDAVRLCDMLNKSEEWQRVHEYQTLCGCSEVEYRCNNSLIKFYAAQNGKAVVMFCTMAWFKAYMNCHSRIRKQWNKKEEPVCNKPETLPAKVDYQRPVYVTDAPEQGANNNAADCYPAIATLRAADAPSSDSQSSEDEAISEQDIFTNLLKQFSEILPMPGLDKLKKGSVTVKDETFAGSNDKNIQRYKEVYKNNNGKEVIEIDDNGHVTIYEKKPGENQFREITNQ